MTLKTVTERDRAMAQRCLECPVCGHARKTQKGLLFWLVQHVEGSICPYCKAYERVYGRKAHEPVAGQFDDRDGFTPPLGPSGDG
jgi:uncharacterized protein CbrC (UPF0167 family)